MNAINRLRGLACALGTLAFACSQPPAQSADGGAGTDSGTVPGDAGCSSCSADAGSARDAGSGADAGGSTDGGPVRHFEYVFPTNGNIDVYDLDNNFALVKSMPVPQLTGVGSGLSAVASVATGQVYVSSGYQGAGTGHVLAFDLVRDTVTWNQSYSFDVDSAAITPDGRTLYQATGAASPNSLWELIDTSTGTARGSIDAGGTGSHDTLVTLDGSKVLMGPRHSNYLVIADTATNAILQRVGPVDAGIRPFTVNGKATLSFINTGGFNGFYVGDNTTGQILYTVSPPGYANVGSCGGSHGVSLSPDERELYLVDCSYNTVHVFDVTGLPSSAPVDVADIKLTTGISAEGWIQHTRDGRYAVVGASGDVIDTSTRTVVGNLPSLQGTLIYTEIDFQNGVPVFAPLSRNQGGYLP